MQRKVITRFVVFATVVCAVFLSVMPAGSAKPLTTYDICIKSNDCVYIAYYNSSAGDYDLTQNGVSIVSGVGTVTVDGGVDQYQLVDNSGGHKFKIIVDLNTGVATVTYKQGATYISYSSLRDLNGCQCGP